MITIIDYGLGNLGSIANMIRKAGGQAEITSEYNTIKKAKKIILPGVGAFDTGMTNLQQLNLIELIIYKATTEKIPLLGICLGMQILTQKSEEGNLPGLGILNADTIRFKKVDPKMKIPHMGWNTIQIKKTSDLIDSELTNARFYFVHSYHLICHDISDILCTTTYGYEFPSAIHRENIYAVQFHPEKSHKYGMRLIQNFIRI